MLPKTQSIFTAPAPADAMQSIHPFGPQRTRLRSPLQERRIGSATFGSHPPALYLPTDVRSCLSSPSVPTYVVVLRGYPVCETKTLELLAHRTTIESQQQTAIACEQLNLGFLLLTASPLAFGKKSIPAMILWRRHAAAQATVAMLNQVQD